MRLRITVSVQLLGQSLLQPSLWCGEASSDEEGESLLSMFSERSWVLDEDFVSLRLAAEALFRSKTAQD